MTRRRMQPCIGEDAGPWPSLKSRKLGSIRRYVDDNLEITTVLSPKPCNTPQVDEVSNNHSATLTSAQSSVDLLYDKGYKMEV